MAAIHFFGVTKWLYTTRQPDEGVQTPHWCLACFFNRELVNRGRDRLTMLTSWDIWITIISAHFNRDKEPGHTDASPMLSECWATVRDGGPTFKQHKVNLSRLPRNFVHKIYVCLETILNTCSLLRAYHGGSHGRVYTPDSVVSVTLDSGHSGWVWVNCSRPEKQQPRDKVAQIFFVRQLPV